MAFSTNGGSTNGVSASGKFYINLIFKHIFFKFIFTAFRKISAQKLGDKFFIRSVSSIRFFKVASIRYLHMSPVFEDV